MLIESVLQPTFSKTSITFSFHLTYEFRRTNQYYLAEFFFAATKVLKLIPKSLSKPSSV